MTNPSPRPALRKAADADVHPAAPRPARSPRARTAPTPGTTPEPSPEAVPVAPAAATPAPLKAPKKGHADAGKPSRTTKRKFSGSTTDHLRVPEVPEVTSSQRAALDHLFENDAQPRAKPSPDTTKPKKAKAPRPVDLMAGKPVDLGASVPKALRKAARAKATEAGLDVDTVVTDLLHAWVTGRG